MNRKKWLKEEEDLLIDLHKQGYNSVQIGNQLNFDKKKITNKLRLLGFRTDTSKSFQHIIKEKECLFCKQKFKYRKNKRKFCSISCSANFQSIIKDEDGNIIEKVRQKKCLFCNDELKKDYKKTRQRKFCSNNCQAQSKRFEIFKIIESGDTTLASKNYKNYLIHKYGAKCMECGWNKKNTISNTIPIELEHIDGNSENNDLKNLKILCPNCHSLTPTYKALNVGNGRHKRKMRYKEGKSF